MTTDQIREALGNAREQIFPQEATDVKEITMEPIQCDWLSFEPVEIITYCDGLQVFTSFVKDRQFLILWCDSTKKISRYLVAEWNSEMRKKLRTKEVDLSDIFRKSATWIFDLDERSKPVRCWKINDINSVSEYLPDPGFYG